MNGLSAVNWKEAGMSLGWGRVIGSLVGFGGFVWRESGE